MKKNLIQLTVYNPLTHIKFIINLLIVQNGGQTRGNLHRMLW